VSKPTKKRICKSCGWYGLDSEVLTAISPFDPDDVISGCPQCKEINTIMLACWAQDCWEEVTMGAFTRDGTYQMLCSKHGREAREEKR
jgi:hypothetical protein